MYQKQKKQIADHVAVSSAQSLKELSHPNNLLSFRFSVLFALRHRFVALDVRKLAADQIYQCLRCEFDLCADASAGHDDRIESLCTAADHRRELLFHADRTASAADIARDLIDLLDMDHLHGLLSD